MSSDAAATFTDTEWELRDASIEQGLDAPTPKKWEAQFTRQDLPPKAGSQKPYLPAYVAITYAGATVRLRAKSRSGANRVVFVASGVLDSAHKQKVKVVPISFHRHWLERVTRDPIDRLVLGGFAVLLIGLAIDLGNLLGSTATAIVWRNVDADTLTHLALGSLLLKAAGFGTAYWKTVEEWKT